MLFNLTLNSIYVILFSVSIVNMVQILLLLTMQNTLKLSAEKLKALAYEQRTTGAWSSGNEQKVDASRQLATRVALKTTGSGANQQPLYCNKVSVGLSVKALSASGTLLVVQDWRQTLVTLHPLISLPLYFTLRKTVPSADQRCSQRHDVGSRSESHPTPCPSDQGWVYHY